MRAKSSSGHLHFVFIASILPFPAGSVNIALRGVDSKILLTRHEAPEAGNSRRRGKHVVPCRIAWAGGVEELQTKGVQPRVWTQIRRGQ